MDHKVSKDMISSGMIPSGEKTQADLGRTQYGSAPSPNSLMEAYRSIYEHHQKDADGKVIEHEEKEELNEGKMPEGLKNYLMKKDKKKDDKKEMKEDNLIEKGMTMATRKIGMQNRAKPTPQKPVTQMNDVDLFDLVKGKLIDEGCEEKEALKLMANASQEQLQQIVEMDKLGGITALTAIGGAGIMGAKKAIQGVNNLRKNLMNKTQQKNNLINKGVAPRGVKGFSRFDNNF